MFVFVLNALGPQDKVLTYTFRSRERLEYMDTTANLPQSMMTLLLYTVGLCTLQYLRALICYAPVTVIQFVSSCFLLDKPD